jgi:CelD/BcsL family acetyltransferase involved in cellulose biosynthesis
MPLIERTDHRAVLALGTEWEDLRRDSSASSAFMTWPWIRAWLETEGADADLEVVTARDPDSGRLVGVAPFYIARTRRGRLPVRELRLLGSGTAAPDHLDLMVRWDAPPGLADALWTAVASAQRWHLINLDGVTTDGHLARAVLRRRGDVLGSLPCPYLPLAGGWDSVASRFENRLRKNLDRYGRKLDRDAEVVERMVADSADLDETFDHLIRLHQSIRTSKGDPGVFARRGMQRFLRCAAHRFLDAGRLRMWRLEADGELIAVIWCVRAGDSVAFYTTGYDPKWSKYGPGRRIMARAIKGAIDEGATEFDFLRGDEPYKRQWGTELRHDLVIRRPTAPRGRVVWLGGAIQRLIRRVLRRGAAVRG